MILKTIVPLKKYIELYLNCHQFVLEYMDMTVYEI